MTKIKKPIPPYTVRLVQGLTRGLLQGYRPGHKYNRQAGISFSKITELMQFRPDGYRFSPKFQNRTWDGWIRMFSQRVDGSISYPVGLDSRIRKFLIDKGLTVETDITYTYQCPTHSVKKVGKKKLREYQVKAANDALRQRRGIIQCPTASGKTTIATAIIATIGGITLWLTNKKDLLYQTQKALSKDLGIPVGIVGDGKRQWESVTVASIKTLFLHQKTFRNYINKVEVLIGDEIHHATGNEWFSIMKSIPGVYRLGLTATPPEGANFMKLEAVCGPVIVKIGNQKLIKEGYLSKPYIYMVKFKKKRVADRSDFQTASRKGIVQNKVRNDTIVQIARDLCKLPDLKPVTIQCRVIEHMRLLRKRLRKTNLKVRYLSGKDPASKRQTIYKEIEEGKIDVMVISSIFDEGIDVKNIRSLIMTSGGKSAGNTIQKLGRGMRTLKSKNSVVVIDFLDECHEYLRKHSKKRIRTYKKEGHDVTMCTRNELLKKLTKR